MSGYDFNKKEIKTVLEELETEIQKNLKVNELKKVKSNKESTNNYYMNPVKPYSDEEYEEAKQQGLDLDNWNDYVNYFGIGEEPNYDDM